MRLMRALPKLQTPDIKKKRAGQSLIEMALALPIMLIMISGLIEFGFALNQYLNSLDAAREAARFATDGDPVDRDLSYMGVDVTDPIAVSTACSATFDFYMQVACIGIQTMAPVQFNPTTDDVVISVFRVLSGTVIDRWPNCEPDPLNDCPFDASPFADVMGEWHLYGRGDGCGNGIDDDKDGPIDDGCPSGPPINGTVSEFCNLAIDQACHPSRVTGALVESRLESDAPDSAVLVVEVFYDYPHLLQLPWITPFVPNPLPLHTYTVLPLPAAEPSITITGTVTQVWRDGTPKLPGQLGGVTILFDNGMTAITEADGSYLRTGLPSGMLQWEPLEAGTDCDDPSTPPEYNEHLTINNLYNMDFELTDCIDVAATNAAATTTSLAATNNQAATNVAGTSTMAAATQTSAAATAGVTPPATSTPTPSATVDPGCLDTVVSPVFSQVTVVNPNPPTVQADGSEALEVLVQVLNQCNTSVNMGNLTVSLSSSRGGTDVISPASVQTDGAGGATFFVSSTTMSEPWDINNRDFAYSVFTAVANGVTINGTSGGAFMCVGGIEGTAINFGEVTWRFQNDTGIDRRLMQVDFSSSQPFSFLDWLIEITFDGVSIWSGSSFSDNPGTIAAGDWLGIPADRIITAGATHDLMLTFNYSVTGNKTFILDARWDNGSGASFCNSNTVTVIR